MPIQSCDPAARGEAHNQVVLQRGPFGSGGWVLCDIEWDWDGVSLWPACDGPTFSIHVQNTTDVTVYAILPNKKVAPHYYTINAGANATTSAKGQLANLGLSNYTDCTGVEFTTIQPAT